MSVARTSKEMRFQSVLPEGEEKLRELDHRPSNTLVSEMRTEADAHVVDGTGNYFLPGRLLLEGANEIERLQTALRGIQSCSACEACRGAATLALGGATTEPSSICHCAAYGGGAHTRSPRCLLVERDSLKQRVAELERNRDLLEADLKRFVAHATKGGASPEPPAVQSKIAARDVHYRLIEEFGLRDDPSANDIVRRLLEGLTQPLNVNSADHWQCQANLWHRLANETIADLAIAKQELALLRALQPPAGDLDERLLQLPPKRWSIDISFHRGEPAAVLSFVPKLLGGTWEQCECFSLGAAIQWIESKLRDAATKEAPRRLKIGDCVMWGCNRKGVVQGPADDGWSVLVKWQNTEIIDAIDRRELFLRNCEPCDRAPGETNVTLTCEGCGTTAELPRVGKEKDFVSIKPADGWELYPRCRCPKCSVSEGRKSMNEETPGYEVVGRLTREQAEQVAEILAGSSVIWCKGHTYPCEGVEIRPALGKTNGEVTK